MSLRDSCMCARKRPQCSAAWHLHALGLASGAVGGLHLEQLLAQTRRPAAAGETTLRQLVRQLRPSLRTTVSAVR